MFRRAVADRKTQPYIKFERLSFTCASGFLNPVIFTMRQRDEYRRRVREICTRREPCYDVRSKQVTRAKVLLKQCTDTYKDLHHATKHIIATNTGLQLSAISPTIPFAVRYAGCVLTRFTMRPDGRTPFQYLLGAPNASAMCVVGQSLCALILDHTILRNERQELQRSKVVAGSPGSVGELSAPGHPSRRL